MKFKLLLAYLNTLTFSCVQMVLYITIPYIATQTGVMTSSIIAAISVGSLVFAGTGPFWAAQSDRSGRERVLSLGMFGMFLSFLCLTLLFVFNKDLSMGSKVFIVFLGRILYGLLVSAVVPVSQAWQLDLIPEGDRMKVLTRNSMFLNLGRILGPILVLAKQVQFEKIIFSATGWVLVLAATNLAFTWGRTAVRAPAVKLPFTGLVAKWKQSLSESLYPILLAMVFTAFVGILHSFLGHHLKVVLGISGEAATLMFAKLILGLSLMAILLQQLSLLVFKSNWKLRVVIGSSALVLGTVIMMRSGSEGMIWVSMGFIAVATSLIPPVYLTLASKSEAAAEGTNVFGKKLGLASIAHSVGYALGAGLIAVSMKLSLLSPAAVVFLISFSIMGLSFLMINKRKYQYA